VSPPAALTTLPKSVPAVKATTKNTDKRILVFLDIILPLLLIIYNKSPLLNSIRKILRRLYYQYNFTKTVKKNNHTKSVILLNTILNT
jgi:hypothetical protein